MFARVFVSCVTKDNWARDDLIEELRTTCPEIELVHLPVGQAYDSSWKTTCRTIIDRTIGTIVLIGRSSHLSEAVLWEIEESKRQNKHILGVSLNADHTVHIPAGINQNAILARNLDQIATRLKTWLYEDK